MHRWNFNVTIPLFDWIHGTIAKDGDAEREEAREETHAVA